MSADSLQGAERSRYLLQLTDCHLPATSGALYRGRDADKTLAAVVADACQQAIPFDHLLLSGDLVHHGPSAAYQRLLESVAPLPGTRLWIPGNHDDLAAMSEVAPVPADRIVDSGPWRIILLNSTSHPDGRGGGSLAASELEWLERVLNESRDRFLLLVLHHNPVPTGSAWQDEIRLGNAAALADLLDGYPQVRGILCGHLHQYQASHFAGIPLWCAPSTVIQFKPGQADLLHEDDPQRAAPGYSWYELCPDGEIHAHPRWLDHEHWR